MERLDVIGEAANALRARMLANQEMAADAGSVLQGYTDLCRLCTLLALEVTPAERDGVMLGGAHARLQLWEWDAPEGGGIIWVSDDLSPTLRLFSVAHELGHYALHRGERQNLHPACEHSDVDELASVSGLDAGTSHVEEYTPRARREREANAFAAELLAPRGFVRSFFARTLRGDSSALAALLGISTTLARQRLVDAVLCSSVAMVARTGEVAPSGGAEAGDLFSRLDPSQRAAARSEAPALIVAGPGTGKTATLIGRVAYLVGERNAIPERILALTFSNRAAGEMRERLARSGLPGERMPVMTIHAFAATLLREYAARVPYGPDERPLAPDFRILDQADAYLLLEDLLTELPLSHYRSLGNPTAHFSTLLADFSRARDNLLTPRTYLELVDAMPVARDDAEVQASTQVEGGHRAKRGKAQKQQQSDGSFTRELIAKARERALAYGVWDRALRRRGLVDFGGLIQRAVELLLADASVLADVRRRYAEVLVDEFQDTNRAAGELLMLVAGESGTGLWVVGDQNQSIYRWRGASPLNLPRLVDRYPALRVYSLRRCYRSVPDIVRLSSSMAQRMAELAGGDAVVAPPAALAEATRPVVLEAVRGTVAGPAVLFDDTFRDAAHESAGLVEAIRSHRATGYGFGDQAVLCRSHRQAQRIAGALAEAGIPVSATGDFFERPEVKDALALISLAAGPDARGLLRAGALLRACGHPTPSLAVLAELIRALSAARASMPAALNASALSRFLPGASAAARASLAELGTIATRMRYGSAISITLADFLLRPGGYAWQLIRVADGLPGHKTTGVAAGAIGQPESLEPRQARAALTALGALVQLAARFDTRWIREDDFRQRLTKAVTHRRMEKRVGGDTTSGAGAHGIPASDAVEWPRDADVADISRQSTLVDSLEREEDAADASEASCFLHYLRALRTADITVSVEQTDEHAVRVLTIHASKGLEFPVVYLPGLALGQFPGTPGGPAVVGPAAMREEDAPGARDAEERCLFYVAVTRARDVIALTRAQRYRSQGTAKASPLLALVKGDFTANTPPPLLAPEMMERLATGVAPSMDEDEDAEDAEDAEQAVTVEHKAGRKPMYTLAALELYHTCPRLYKYAQYYGLLDPATDAVHRFHRYVRYGMRDLRTVREQAPDTDWMTVRERLRASWADEGPVGHAYEAFYWRHAEGILQREWSELSAAGGETTGGRVALAQDLSVEIADCVVTLKADRLAHAEASAGSQRTYVRLHTGRPREAHREDVRLPLYYLAHQQRTPGEPLSIQLAYVGNALEHGEPDAHEHGGGRADVTDEAITMAERYRSGKRSRMRWLDKAAAGIAAGHFAPKPDDRKCAACAFNVVCPGDPEESQ